MRRQTKIPIIFEQQKKSTKDKLAKLLKKYNACMRRSDDQNTYQVDVEVKFNSVEEKIQFMESYLRRPGKDGILEQKEPNSHPKYLDDLRNQKDIINLSSIKKSKQFESKLNQSSFDLSNTVNHNVVKEESSLELQQFHHTDHHQGRSAQVERSSDSLDFQQLALRLQEAIDRSCSEILLMKIRPDMVSSSSERIKVINNNQFDTGKKSSRDDYSIFAYSGKTDKGFVSLINSGVKLPKKQRKQSGIIKELLIDEKREQDEISLPSLHNKVTPEKDQGENSDSMRLGESIDSSSMDNPNKVYSSIPSAPKQFQSPSPSKQASCNSSSSYVQQTSYSKLGNQSHKEFKKFLDSCRSKIDNIVQSLHPGTDSNNILVQDESLFESQEDNQDFNNRIIQEYKQKIIANSHNLNSSESVRYFRFLIKHAKGLYLEFQRAPRK